APPGPEALGSPCAVRPRVLITVGARIRSTSPHADLSVRTHSPHASGPHKERKGAAAIGKNTRWRVAVSETNATGTSTAISNNTSRPRGRGASIAVPRVKRSGAETRRRGRGEQHG